MSDTKYIGDATAVVVAISAWAQIITPIAALVSIAWVAFQAWHHPTVKAWVAKWRARLKS